MALFIRVIFSILFTFSIVKRALKRKTLSGSGSVAAFIVGTLVTLSSLYHMICLLTFFNVCNKATKFRNELKRKFDTDFKEDGQRDATQVLSNGFFPALFSAMYLVECGYGERPIDFLNDYKSTWYTVAILASLSCACGDTLASELGSVIGNKRSRVFHLVEMRMVPRGANGGMSFVGTLASILGGSAVGIGYFLSIRISYMLSDHMYTIPQYPVIYICACSGFFGSLVDSILGGWLQYSGVNEKTQQIVSEPAKDVIRISGHNLLTNSQVNFLSCFFMALMVPNQALKYYRELIGT